MSPAAPVDLAFGVDIGGTKMLGVALAGTAVVAEARLPTPHGPLAPGEDGATLVAESVAAVVGELVAEVGRPAGTGDARPDPPVGIGAPGMVDRRGVLRNAPNLPGAAGADLGPLVARRLAGGTAVVVENDAAAAALAEWRLGAARGADDVLMVTLGTGIGGAVIADGRVLLGSQGFAGEIGHMVVDPSGPPCPCGRRGCWERFASGGGLGRLAREAAHAGRIAEVVALAGGDPESVRGEHVTRAAQTGDAGALAVMDELGWWVALGLANLVAVVDSARIVVGGGLAEAGDVLLAPTRASFDGQVEGGADRPPAEISLALLGERAGAVGAALAARSGGLG